MFTTITIFGCDIPNWYYATRTPNFCSNFCPLFKYIF